MVVQLEATEESRRNLRNRGNPYDGRTTATTTAKTDASLSSSCNASMMESTIEANDERLEQATSPDGSDGTDTVGFSGGDQVEEESEHLIVNEDENNSNANCAEGDAGPEMSAATSSPSRSVSTLRVKKTVGKAQKSKARRFVGVRQRPSGRWVAEIKDSTQNIRLWLGTYDNAEDAAAAYDEAARALRGSNTRTNFGLPKDGRPELPSKTIRLLLQRAKAASAAKTHPFNLNDSNSADYRTSYDMYHHQQARQMYPKPDDGVVVDPDSHFSHNTTMEADRGFSHSHPIMTSSTVNPMNSFAGRTAQQQQHRGASGLSGRPSTSSTAELGTPDTEEKFTKAFIEMYTQLPSKRNAPAASHDDGEGRCQSGSSTGQTCSYGAANYNTGARGEFVDVGTGPGVSGDHVTHVPRMGRPASVYNVNSEQQHNAGRMRQLMLPSAERDVGTALPTVYSNLARKLKDYLQSSYPAGGRAILWQQASSANLLSTSSSAQNPSVCPTYNASSFLQQEQAGVDVLHHPTSVAWMECESTSSHDSQPEIPVSTPGLFRSISDSLRSPGVPFPSADFLPQDALWSQTQEPSTVPVC